MSELQENFPPGWDCRLDEKSGKYYFVNHFTKTTTWDDPRNRHRPFQATPKHFASMPVEHIPLQHGSPDLRRNYIYPSHTSSPIPAFQMPNQSPKSTYQEMRNVSRMSPKGLRVARVQDSSLTQLTISDTEEAVAKISAMFPTVSETHIKLLMKKYHNREALVISALQVEKYPITTPGPYATPPPQRNIIHHPPSYQMTPPLGLRTTLSSRGGSPIFRPGSGTNSTYTGSPRIGENFRNSPRPHSSPKLKLRYMKSCFPNADETLILEMLQSNENSIQKATEALKEAGYSKKDTVKVAQLKANEKKEEEKKIEEAKEKAKSPKPQIRTKSNEEKDEMKEKFKQKYKDLVADHLITIALESVDFDDKRANQILQIIIQEDNEKSKVTKDEDTIDVVESYSKSTELNSALTPDAGLPISQSRQSIKSLLKSERSEKERLLSTFSRMIEESDSYKSQNLLNTKGRNPDLSKGPNDKLLLEDYVKWQGPNPNNRKGSQSLAKGQNASLLTGRSYKACGPNADLRKGPKFGLAKGSIFSQMKAVLVGDVRGK